MTAPVAGSIARLVDDEWGLECYTEGHEHIKAVVRICSETDSFGSEYFNMCKDCFAQHKLELAEIEKDPTRWDVCKCGTRQPCLVEYRDPDEGYHGPVYHSCNACYAKFTESFRKECEQDLEYNELWDRYHDDLN